MPELPDVVLYLDALTRFVVGHQLEHVSLHSAFVLRSVEPPLATLDRRTVGGVLRIGKRVVLSFEPESGRADSGDGLYLVLHLMIAGRLRWRSNAAPVKGQKKAPAIPPKLRLASLAFSHGTLVFTEASSKKRASMQVVRGAAALAALDPGGIDPLAADVASFAEALTRESHTLKRALTDPRLFSGIGNAYSDEILHAARLSPLKLTRSLTGDEVARLHTATGRTLQHWVDALKAETGEAFPEKVTAFREAMAVHGRFRLPCPVCGAPVQRIVYAENECNYCARCQTGGRLLADRSLSRLLKSDWPRSIDDL